MDGSPNQDQWGLSVTQFGLYLKAMRAEGEEGKRIMCVYCIEQGECN